MAEQSNLVRRETFGSWCARALAKQVTLGEFFRANRSVFGELAVRLMSRWGAGSAVDVEDVMQELMIGSVWAFRRYDPTHPRAAALEQFVLYNACDKAKKWLHRQRGAILHGNADANPSRYAVLFSDLIKRRDGEDAGQDVEWLSDELKQEPDQDAEVERRERWRCVLRKTPSIRLRWGIMALESSRGDREAAARRLYDNLDLRLRLRLNSERDARKIIWETLRHLAAA